MDRPVKGPIDAESLTELAQKLLSPSRDCNVQGAAFYRQTIYSLANKAELERVIQESMRDQRSPTPAQSSAQNAPLAAALVAGHSPQAVSALPENAAQQLRETAKKEYRPALQDPELLEALLAFHNQASAPKPQPAAVPASKNQPASDPANGAFSHVRAPEIEARPKSGRYMSRTPGVSRTILRSHDE